MDQTGVVLQSIRHSYSASTVSSAAWVQLSPALNGHTNWIEFFEDSGNPLELGQGPAGSETRICIIPPGGFATAQALVLSKDMRLSVRALSGSVVTGQILINLKG